MLCYVRSENLRLQYHFRNENDKPRPLLSIELFNWKRRGKGPTKTLQDELESSYSGSTQVTLGGPLRSTVSLRENKPPMTDHE